MSSSDGLNHVAVYHGPPCTGGRSSAGRRCSAVEGDVLVETWNRGKASVDMEWLVSKQRVDGPDDHAASCARWGPDVESESAYPDPTTH
jgi:hypothetical protein